MDGSELRLVLSLKDEDRIPLERLSGLLSSKDDVRRDEETDAGGDETPAAETG